jgi:hypothetical protein
MSLYEKRTRLGVVSTDLVDWKWHTMGSFVMYGPYVERICLTKWGARRVVKRNIKKDKVPW